MAFDTTGTLHKIFETEVKKNNFQVRNFVLKTEGQYPQVVKFQLTQDRCDIVNAFNEGDQIKVHFDIRGTEWNGNYITNLNAWRIEKAQQEVANQGPPSVEEFPSLDQSAPESNSEMRAEDFEDLPF